jgi:predicted nucleic acid-binding protein
MGLMDDIGRGPVGLDTAIFIYFIEEHPVYLDIVLPLFESIDRRQCTAATSALTLLETLVVPYRFGDAALASRYEALLTHSRGLRFVELDRPVLKAGALLRARFGVRTPDALHLAAAMHAGCTSFLTHDRDLSKVQGMKVLQLGDYLED